MVSDMIDRSPFVHHLTWAREDAFFTPDDERCQVQEEDENGRKQNGPGIGMAPMETPAAPGMVI